MTFVVTFGAVLLVAVLVSDRADRTVMSTAVLFLIAGFVAGRGALGLIEVSIDDDAISLVAELALLAILFTDGMKIGLDELSSAWRLPGRALVFGLPLTVVLTAALGHFVLGFGWLESFLLGAALAPTDPVFAAALVGRPGIPWRLGNLLNVESGLNDGLALPLVIVLLTVLTGDTVSYVSLIEEVVLGIVIGVLVPWVAIRLERLPFFSSSTAYRPLGVLSIALLVFSISRITGANEFLGMFSAGITIASLTDEAREAVRQFGELVAEVLKLLALMMLGAFISPALLHDVGWHTYVFALLVLVAARPIAMTVALFRSPLTSREWAAAAWFGPKGFASVVYGLLILGTGTAMGEKLFEQIAIVVIGSIILHSSSDVLMAGALEVTDEEPAD